MQQNNADLRRDEAGIRFGVDLQSTEASYRQALWGAARLEPQTAPQAAVGATPEPVARPAV